MRSRVLTSLSVINGSVSLLNAEVIWQTVSVSETSLSSSFLHFFFATRTKINLSLPLLPTNYTFNAKKRFDMMVPSQITKSAEPFLYFFRPTQSVIRKTNSYLMARVRHRRVVLLHCVYQNVIMWR